MRRQKTTKNGSVAGKADKANLTPQQEQAAELLAAGQRMGDVASTVGVHRATVWEWTRLLAFREAGNQLRRAAWRSAADRMRQNTAKAAEVLGAILEDPQAENRDRIAAARVVFGAAGSLYPGPLGPALEERGLEPAGAGFSWEALATSTAKEAAEMTGESLWDINYHTPGQFWAGAGLPADAFEHLKGLAGNPDEARTYCAELLEEWRDYLDAEAFKKAGRA